MTRPYYGQRGESQPEGRSRHRRHRVTGAAMRRLRRAVHEVDRKVRVLLNRQRGRHDRASVRVCPLCGKTNCLWMSLDDGRFVPRGPHGQRPGMGQVRYEVFYDRQLSPELIAKLNELLAKEFVSWPPSGVVQVST